MMKNSYVKKWSQIVESRVIGIENNPVDPYIIRKLKP
jgi:hypothetical protein